MEKYDLIIVGAGPAGIFTAVELFRRGAHKKILMVEKGQSVEKRSCPKSKTQKCVPALQHHDRLLRRRRILGRQALAEPRGRRRFPEPRRPGLCPVPH